MDSVLLDLSKNVLTIKVPSSIITRVIDKRIMRRSGQAGFSGSNFNCWEGRNSKKYLINFSKTWHSCCSHGCELTCKIRAKSEIRWVVLKSAKTD